VLQKVSEQSGFLTVKKVYAFWNQGNQRTSVSYESQDGLLAGLVVDIPDETIFKANISAIAAALHEEYTFSRKSEVLGLLLPQTEQEKLRYYERSLSELTAAVAKLGEVSTQQIERQADFLQKKSAEMDAELFERTATLRQDYETKASTLVKERADCEKEKAALDLQKSTDARRKLKDDLKTLIGEDFTIKDKTLDQRENIKKACLTAICFGALLALCGLGRLLFAATFDWRYVILFWAGLVIGGSTLIYFLRFDNHWFSSLASNEFNTRKLKIDVLRASWIAEMLLEWTEDRENPFPEQLLTSFSEGLFREDGYRRKDHHPATDAISLLRKVTSLKLSKDGVEVCKK
jgi:hypothetical protein